MKKLTMIILLLSVVSNTACFYRAYEKIIKGTINIDEAVETKLQIDQTKNPAMVELIEKDIENKLIKLDNVIVKEVKQSTNIEYKYSVLVEVMHKQGKINCFIYSKDLGDISELKEGVSRINVLGNFGRFYKLLDDSFVNIDILNSDIDLLD